MVDARRQMPRSKWGAAALNRGKGKRMTWKTPKIVEISVAMEINSYACAEV